MGSPWCVRTQAPGILGSVKKVGVGYLPSSETGYLAGQLTPLSFPPACSNAGGRWFQSPCYTLQACIDNRPANGTQGYSPSFEQFALGITITDPSNTTQCDNARQQLGYTPDYPYDVDV